MVNQRKPSINQQLALAIQLNDEATLADFNWGTNVLLKQQIEHMLSLHDERFLYIWGSRGSGKSHLLQACCQAFSAMHSAIYLPLRLLREWGPQTIEGIEGQALICIDDIDAIAHLPDWEEALFHLYNRIKDEQEGLLIISGNTPPPNLPIQLADLRSRLGWGLVIQINELNDEEKIETIKRHALKRGFVITEGVGQYLLNRCSRNMHDLHHLLNQLDEASLVAQRKITIPFVKETLNL